MEREQNGNLSLPENFYSPGDLV